MSQQSRERRTFEKNLEITGKCQTVRGKIIITIYDNSRMTTSSHPSTHEDVSKIIHSHKAEFFINQVSYAEFSVEKDLDSFLKRVVQEEGIFKQFMERLSDKKPTESLEEVIEKMGFKETNIQ